MIKIDGKTIKVHRGDVGNIRYKIPVGESEGTTSYYKFKTSDVVRLSIFEKNSDYQTTIAESKVVIESECEEVSIPLTANETNIGTPTGKPVEYIYEISLNGVNTTTGYDDDEGALKYKILPAKGSDE